MIENVQRPTPAFIGASWLALIVGAEAFMIGLGNASMDLNVRGYYFTILMYGPFAAVSLQKSVRDLAVADALQPPTAPDANEGM
jgi:uncharacterized membrane protein YiaA